MNSRMGAEDIQSFAGNLLAELNLAKMKLSQSQITPAAYLMRVRTIRSAAERGKAEYQRATEEPRETVAEHFKRNRLRRKAQRVHSQGETDVIIPAEAD